MSKRKNFSPTHPELPFPIQPGADSLASQVRDSLALTIHKHRNSIDQIAEGLSKRLGTPISRHVLHAFTADSYPHRFPLEWAAAWIKETGDYDLLRVLCDALGLPTPEPGSENLVGFAKARIEADLAGQEADGYKARILRGGLR